MKIRLVGTELFYADRRTDRQTDMTKLIVVFRNLTNASKKSGGTCCSNVQKLASVERAGKYNMQNVNTECKLSEALSETLFAMLI